MQAFNFATTAQILCETGSAQRLGSLCHERGAQSVLIVTDPGITRLGMLDALLPVYVQSRVFHALLQSSAAKHAATQKAMKSASDNADKLITDYTRLRNNARQAEITQQIAEIVGGADALSSK